MLNSQITARLPLEKRGVKAPEQSRTPGTVLDQRYVSIHTLRYRNRLIPFPIAGFLFLRTFVLSLPFLFTTRQT